MTDIARNPSVLAVGLDPVVSPAIARWTDLLTAATSQEALQLLQLLRFDLVLVNADLPQHSIRTVLGELRRRSPSQACAVYSATMPLGDERAVRTAGVLAVLDTGRLVPQVADLARHLCVRRTVVSRRQPRVPDGGDVTPPVR